MYYLRTEQSFDSAHFLSGYQGKCKNIHGHRWKVVVCIASEELGDEGQTRGMLVDFGELKAALKGICDELDHSFIYEKDSLRPETVAALETENFRLIEMDFRPTAENFSRYIYERMSGMGYPVRRVEVHETPHNIAAYEG